MSANYFHIPVLLKEVKEILKPCQGKIFVDGTVGLGGHTKELAKSGAKVIGLDKDEKALRVASKNVSQYKNIKLIQANFADIDKILTDLGIKKVDGILLDLGVSSMQLEDESRGFSFQKDSPLDMRLDQSQNLTAEKIVNRYSEDDLERIFIDFGEERFGVKIAREIIDQRQKKPLKTTSQLVEVIKRAIPAKYRYQRKIHFATNVFRGLRMEVNGEVKDLSQFLNKATKCLKPGGKIIIISFHSIEDRIVKRGFKMLQSRGQGEILFKKPQLPSSEEIEKNPRARSAKLRAIKIG